MRRRLHRAVIGTAVSALGLGALAGFGASAAAAASTSSVLAGYAAEAQALGLQFAANVPDLIPLPNQNLVEDDIPFSRTLVTNGPVVDALGAPYYPGDVAADVGTLLQTFGVPLPVPNDTALAEAKYPASPGFPATSSFGVPAPAGSPVTPNLVNSSAAASANGGLVTATLSDVSIGVPGVKLLDIGSIQSTNSVQITPSEVISSASSIIKTIDIAGILDITEITSNSGTTSDGTTGTPNASLRLGQVTIAGLPGYIDQNGVHVDGQTEAVEGITPAEAQSLLNSTLSQDGITVRLADPETTTSAGQGSADSGGLVISFSHEIALPTLSGIPPLPSLPGLGTVSIPAGIYTVTASLTLGSAVTSVNATSIGALSPNPGPSSGGGTVLGGTGLGATFPSLSSGVSPLSTPGSTVTTIAPNGPGTTSAPTPTPIAVAPLNDRLPFGVPTPVGWIIVAIVLCVLVAYPLLVIARWQYVGGRRR